MKGRVKLGDDVVKFGFLKREPIRHFERKGRLVREREAICLKTIIFHNGDVKVWSWKVFWSAETVILGLASVLLSVSTPIRAI